jgi:ferredoxin-like protein FixX
MRPTIFQKDTSSEHIARSQSMDNPNCERCGGLMVDIQCLDIDDPSGQLWFDAKHCIQCGNLIDPVILENQIADHSSHQDRVPRPRPSYAVSLQGRKK